MKTKLTSSIFIAIIISGMFAFIIEPCMFFVGAAHVEEHIVQDTVWTLTDSPYIVIRDVIVDSNATLTIEPGVEVRFGGDFSLIINGTLDAKGTEEKPIKFTSNKLQPQPGDWKNIRFTSLQLSYLENCIVEYAINGTTVENGSVLITKCEISHNFQNGVYITGNNNNASITGNRIETNLNGIFIGGNSSGILIKRNRIYLNDETGIYLNTNQTTQIDNTLIVNNSISTNPIGICIYGRVKANITKNTISYNDLGILYSNASNIMPLHYNDFYNNNIAARASSSDPVNAEHNYWGDASGPYHVSLNPLGKGNPVESNGTDLDFIPFLTINNSYINQRPMAYLITDKQVVALNDEVTFIGTLSWDDRQVYWCFFDFGDGNNSGWTTLSIFKHRYNFERSYNASLMVMDDFGVTSNNPAVVTMNVTNLTPLKVDLQLDKYTVEYGENVSIIVQVLNGTTPINDANVTLIAIKDGIFQQIKGTTNSSGYFTTIFVAPHMPQIKDIRIIATASKRARFADGSSYRYLRVLPPLWVEITTEPEMIKSEDNVNVKIDVTYDGLPISGADTVVSFDINGNILTKTGTTDENGYATFAIVAPQTLIPLNLTIKVNATKSGYIDGKAQIHKTIEPRTLVVFIKAEPDFIGSGETSLITVNVTSDGEPVPNATVTLSSDSGGKINPEIGITNENGSATFAFVAFGTMTQKHATITARATKTAYVSGEAQIVITIEPRTSEVHIVQDTAWTLTDSPYIIVRDVIVESNATLTIEPGVEVRCGGNFSLIIEGKLYAKGTKEKPIKFTSNRLQPQPGDWKTINFMNAKTSTLEYCVIEYAFDGITIDNSSVQIANSTISNNLNSGIFIMHGNNAILKGNWIAFNRHGVYMYGEASGVSLTENRIFSNSESGIVLEAATSKCIENVLIFNNSISTNHFGVHVYGWVNVNISKNIISYNEIGVLYENAIKPMPMRYNDIYENEKGIDVFKSEIVYADYNYWGDPSGPYHASLNPLGKGNPVGGDGINPVFIPFSTINNNHLNQPPTANLIADKQRVTINQTVTFIATNSVDDGRVCWYFFDFGDKSNSGWTTLSIFAHKYSSEGNYTATLIVMDDFGVRNKNVASVKINVQENLTSLHVNLVISSDTVAYGEQISIFVNVTNGTSGIENANITLIAIKGGVFNPSSGTTNATGCFNANFIAPNVTQITNIRIIATASKDGYTDGADYQYLQVLPPLLVKIFIEKPSVESGEATSVAVQVTYNMEPISEAEVKMQFFIGGNISKLERYTNEDGFATFVFTAPQTSIPINVTIMATAEKSGYIYVEAQAQITVQPKIFEFNITIQPNIISSEETSVVIVSITHNGTPLADAVVTMSSTAGKLSFLQRTTGADGNATFVFTAPLVNEETSVSITITMVKLGYAPREATAVIVVKPGTFTVLVIANPSVIESGKSVNITVYVRQNGPPISNATVSVTAEAGTFSKTMGLTDLNGCCTFLFTAPQTDVELPIVIIANATKFGYISEKGETTITVTAEAAGGGWSILTILLILIPIIIAVVVVILIKLKIIVISTREEEL